MDIFQRFLMKNQSVFQTLVQLSSFQTASKGYHGKKIRGHAVQLYFNYTHFMNRLDMKKFTSPQKCVPGIKYWGGIPANHCQHRQMFSSKETRVCRNNKLKSSSSIFQVPKQHELFLFFDSSGGGGEGGGSHQLFELQQAL